MVGEANPMHRPNSREQLKIMNRICQYFELADSMEILWKEHVRPELIHYMTSSAMAILEGMMKVDAAMRWTAEDLVADARPGSDHQEYGL